MLLTAKEQAVLEFSSREEIKAICAARAAIPDGQLVIWEEKREETRVSRESARPPQRRSSIVFHHFGAVISPPREKASLDHMVPI